MKKICMITVCVLALSMPLWADSIRPPSWLQGQWTVSQDEQTALVRFAVNDIFIDDKPLSELLILIGSDIEFTQKVTYTEYTIRITSYTDNTWSEETYTKPTGRTLTSVTRTSDGGLVNLTYQKK
ncbi:hypothetical protein ACYULU_11115 [Breznakiellaceae bacterium SP9]